MPEERQPLDEKRKILKKLKKLVEEWNGEYEGMEPEVRQYFDKVDKDLKNLEKNLKAYFEKLQKEFENEEAEYLEEVRVKEEIERKQKEEIQRQKEIERQEQEEAEGIKGTTETKSKKGKDLTDKTKNAKCKYESSGSSYEMTELSNRRLTESEYSYIRPSSTTRPTSTGREVSTGRPTSATSVKFTYPQRNLSSIIDMEQLMDTPYTDSSFCNTQNNSI